MIAIAKIAIIDGCGTNIASLQFALERLKVSSLLTHEADVIRMANHVILPGVGTANSAMQSLERLGLVEVIRNLQQPVLGICLGMQLLFEQSTEGDTPCLKLLRGNVKPFKKSDVPTIPHMGWNRLRAQDTEHPLLHGIGDGSYVYYAHSYAVPAAISPTLPTGEHTIATTQYGAPFSAIVSYKNFFGMQFHPEKSGAIGEQLLKNFLSIEAMS